MRPIKFRAWDKKFKKMYEGDIRIVLAFPNDDVEIMQFTGLKDKNGKEIYEGDILCFTGLSKFHQRPFVIEWNERQARWTEYDPKDQAEVIGNIYQDSHLLDNHKDM